MGRQYVTLLEANSMLPMVRERLFIIAQLHMQVQMLLEELEELGYEPTDDSFDVQVDGAPIEATIGRATLQALLESLRGELELLEGRGCIVKDIDTGTVGWYATDDRWGEVFLSWKSGERTVTHWHEVDTGQIRRRDISELDRPAAAELQSRCEPSGMLRDGEGR